MKNYKSIKRLFEEEAISQADVAEFGLQPEMDQESEFNLALPAEGESTVEVDPMTMTVRDLLAKCKEIDPLVCMGIESFIEKNRAAFAGETSEIPATYAGSEELPNFTDVTGETEM